MTQDELKKAVGWAALQYVQPGTIVGVGTGSTAAHFIDALGTMKGQIEGAVSSSDASTEKLKSLGITVFDLNEVDRLGIYVDGADGLRQTSVAEALLAKGLNVFHHHRPRTQPNDLKSK